MMKQLKTETLSTAVWTILWGMALYSVVVEPSSLLSWFLNPDTHRMTWQVVTTLWQSIVAIAIIHLLWQAYQGIGDGASEFPTKSVVTLSLIVGILWVSVREIVHMGLPNSETYATRMTVFAQDLPNFVWLVGLVVIAPTVESLIARGMVGRGVFMHNTWMLPIVMSVVLSLIMQQPSNIADWVDTIGLGVVAMGSYLYTRNIFAPIIIHMLHNLAIVVSLLFGGV